MVDNGILCFVPQFVDRAGRTVYNIHTLPNGRRTPGTISGTPVVGQARFDPQDAEVDPVIEWQVKDLLSDVTATD